MPTDDHGDGNSADGNDICDNDGDSLMVESLPGKRDAGNIQSGGMPDDGEAMGRVKMSVRTSDGDGGNDSRTR